MSNTENKITGTIIDIQPVESISNGQYRKQVFAIKNNEGYNGREQVFAFEIFEKAEVEKSKIDQLEKFNLVGDLVDVSYEIRCNENNGRYFTTLSAWKVFAADGAKKSSAATATGSSEPQDDDPLNEDVPF